MVVVHRLDQSPYTCRGRIRVGNVDREIFFSSELQLSDSLADALLILALPAAMRRGERLRVEAEVSGRLLENLDALQAVYHGWDPGLQPIGVEAAPRTAPTPAPGRPRALAFTGGVDSFYSLLQDPDLVPVFVHGLDVPLRRKALRKLVAGRLKGACAELGRPLLEVETNLRSFSDRWLRWNLAYGAGLAACAHLLSDHLSEFHVSFGAQASRIVPDGGHPQLVPLFSSESIQFRTVGLVSRIEKLRSIASSMVAHNSLRVCWENRGGAYNCGACDKCLRTMAALEALGCLSEFTVFDRPLRLNRLAWATPTRSLRFFTEEILEVARNEHASSALIAALESSLSPWKLRLWAPVKALIPRSVWDLLYRLAFR